MCHFERCRVHYNKLVDKMNKHMVSKNYVEKTKRLNKCHQQMIEAEVKNTSEYTFRYSEMRYEFFENEEVVRMINEFLRLVDICNKNGFMFDPKTTTSFLFDFNELYRFCFRFLKSVDHYDERTMKEISYEHMSGITGLTPQDVMNEICFS